MFLRRRVLGLSLPGLVVVLLGGGSLALGKPPVGRLTQLPGGDPEPPLVIPENPGIKPVPPPPLPDWPAPPPLVVPPQPEPPLGPPPHPEPPLGLPPHPEPPLGLPHPEPVEPPDPPPPVVTLKVRVAACAAPGQEIEYRICVENTSPAPAHHVLVRNPLPANTRLLRATPPPSHPEPDLQWYLGTLPGLASREIVLMLQPLGLGDVKSCARVQYEHGQCVCIRIAGAAPPIPGVPGLPGVPPPPEKVVPAPKGKAKLALEVKAPAEKLVTDPATYTITLTNPGTGPATNVLITAVLPEKTEFVSATLGGHYVAPVNSVTWPLWPQGTLDAGGSRTVELVLKAKAPGKHCVKAEALADEGLTAKAEACTVFKKGASAVLLRMEDTKDPIAVGEETSYVIVVLNQGEVPVTNIRIKATVPKEMEFVRATGPTEHHKGELAKEGQVFLFEPVASLAPGAKANYEVFTKALPLGGARSRDARFRVELTADQLQAGGPVREEESTMLFQDDDPS
jgi:uncharacterized repeat protein (TIGR01451 family)